MTHALMDTTEQGNLLKTQPSLVICSGYNNQILRSLRALLQTEGAHPASVDTILARIVGFTGELDQELKKLTAQQIIDLIRSKPEIMPLESAQDLARKSTPKIKPTAFLPQLIQLLQQSLNLFTSLNPFYNQPPQQQMQGQQPLQYLFQYSGQPMQYPIQSTKFPAISPLNPILPTMNPPQTQINEHQLPSNENIRDQQNAIQPNQQIERAANQPIERSRQNETVTSKRDQLQRQSKRSISPTYKRVDDSEKDDFMDEIIRGIAMPHLSLLRNSSVIQYKNSKWYSKLATQKPFTFRDCREFKSDTDFLLEQINISHYLSKEFKSQILHDKPRKNESVRIYEREKEYMIESWKRVKRKRLDEVILEAEAKKKQCSSSSCSSSSKKNIRRLDREKKYYNPMNRWR
ncbi:MAG: hypothetical protein EZS28_033664 [Streblomastix strix]|uniref:Uncharacterized protein n=1 Tax=Streblomastix strix TaxID=222440 RepID=A0A5J4UJT7_9EUKA|nr:MAG: hypothetical protein EZS28_033664 [Streblomastix strix]